MYGAILGDIVGSRFEFDRGPWTKEFVLFTDECNWTDDTVMTVAVAEALVKSGKNASIEEIKKACIKSMKKWGGRYPYAGYGARFINWVLNEESTPYNSFGNGSAMRVSAAGWLYDSLERTREVAVATAEVSHNHPEGIKGAECTAAVIYLARNGVSKEEIRKYVVEEFGYDISMTVDEMRPYHRHDETCMDALPKALISFLEGESFEDIVRNAVSLGGDTDTIAAIAGAMAESYYGIPREIKNECLMRIEEDMRNVVNEFQMCLCNEVECGDMENLALEYALTLLLTENDSDRKVDLFYDFLNVLANNISNNAMVPMPFVDVNNSLMQGLNIEQLQEGDLIRLQEDVHLKFDTMVDKNDDLWLPLFTSQKELRKGETAKIIMPITIYDLLKAGFIGNDVKGVVINPFGRSFILDKSFLEKFLGDYRNWAEENGIK